MLSVINKIFSHKIDEEVHGEFIKYSRGVFNNKYLITAKKQKEGWNIKTSNEFANFLVRKGLEKIKGKGQLGIKGVIVSTFDLRDKVDFEISSVKQFMGIKQLVIDTRIEPEKMLQVMDNFPRAFFALSFAFPGFELKIKPKAPKSAKPSTKGGEDIKVDFCSLKTSIKDIADDLFFDVPSFSGVSINHSLNINGIETPKGESDPIKIRENALRKGKILRKIEVDGKSTTKEIEFIA